LNKRRVISGTVGAAFTFAALWAYFFKPHPHSTSAHPAQVTPIVDGATIDFSNGKPVVGNTDADKAAMDAAVKQMDDAAKSVTFKAEPPAKK
jgi:hypothetical protein